MFLLGQFKVFEEASEIFKELLHLDVSAPRIQRVSKYYGSIADGAITKNIKTCPQGGQLFLDEGSILWNYTFLYAIYAVYLHFFTNITIHGWTSGLLRILFIDRFQFFVLGIIVEYTGKLFIQAKTNQITSYKNLIYCPIVLYSWLGILILNTRVIPWSYSFLSMYF
jgi:hypothetical protein